MLKGYSKLKKIISYVFICVLSLCIGTNVLADYTSMSLIHGTKINFNDGWSTFVKTYNLPSGTPTQNYAFCLDPNKSAGWNYSKVSNNGNANEYRRIVDAAIAEGLYSNSNEYGLSKNDFYGVTQLAIWKVEKKANYGTWWLSQNAGRKNLYNKLLNARYDKSLDYSLAILSDGNTNNYVDADGNWIKNIPDGSWYIGGTLPTNATYTIKVTDDSTNDACLLIGNSSDCVKQGTITPNQRFKVKLSTPAAGSTDSIKASFTVESSSFVSDYDVVTWGIGAGYQRITTVIPKSQSLNSKQSISITTTPKTTVKFAKKDAENGSYVEGAILGIMHGGELLYSFETTSSEGTFPSYNLPEGDYQLSEIKAPAGYIRNTMPVNFSIVDDGGVLKVKQNGEIKDNAIISIIDKKNKFKFVKKDSKGNPVEGVTIEIGSYVQALVENHEMYICAVTDEKGELTKPCTDIANPNDYYSPTGYYSLPTVVGSSDLGPVYMNIYYVEERNADRKYSLDGLTGYDYGFGYLSSTNQVFIGNTSLELEAPTGDDSTMTINIVNTYGLDISKTDLVSGKEIEGAEMLIYAKEDVYENEEGVLTYPEIDSWTSSATAPHKFKNIIPGKRYVLSEKISPEGYLKLSTDIEFEMDEAGNVKVYDVETGKENKSLAGTDYLLKVPNDYTKVTIKKTDATTGEEIPGAELKVCTKSSYDERGLSCIPEKDDRTWVSGETPHEIDKLSPGEYCIIETIAPTGYVKSTSAACFKVEESGEVQPVEFKNQPTKVTISKFDKEDGKPIKGATLQLFNADGTELKDAEGNLLKWTTDGNPKVIERLPIGDYILKELASAEGYESDMYIEDEVINEYAFSITDEVYEQNIEIYNVKVPNTGVSVSLYVIIGGALILAGFALIKLRMRKSTN